MGEGHTPPGWLFYFPCLSFACNVIEIYIPFHFINSPSLLVIEQPFALTAPTTEFGFIRMAVGEASRKARTNISSICP